MNTMKKIASLALTVILVLAMSVPAFAATVTVPKDLDGHSFTAYQIFDGTQAVSEGPLGDVVWGEGIDGDNFLAALQADETIGTDFTACKTAADVAAALGKYENNSDKANVVAKIAYKHIVKAKGKALVAGENDLDDGYYLIVDTTNMGADDHDAYNAALLQVTDNIDIGVKTDKPSVEKKVNEESYIPDDGFGNGYNDVADYDIGDKVPFAFYSKVPDMSQYDTYTYVFHDVMSAGLTLDANSVEVRIGGTLLTKGTDYELVTTGLDDGCTFEIKFTDLKKITAATKGADIRVDYKAELNKNAEIGLDGNPNKVRLEYSNNPNGNGTGKTPWDSVIVFTYELDVNKVDGKTNEVLKDAEFKLSNADETLWAKVDANGKLDGWTEDKDEATVLTTDANGFFKVIGLDEGTYKLHETKAPAGYNKLDKPIEFTITATTNNGQDWAGNPADALTKIEITVDGTTSAGNVDNGSVSTVVKNNSGAELPETGGMGTKLFYVVGGLMVVGASVAMITRKRMSKEK